MIAPGLCAKAQADADRTRKWSQPYYQQWAARVKAEMVAERLAGFPDDEMLNDLSEGEDDYEEKINLRRHAPTPLSMPASPVMASATPGLSLQTSFIPGPLSGQDTRAISPVDIDVGLMAEFRQSVHRQALSKYAMCSRHGNHQNKQSCTRVRSRVSARSELFQIPSTDSSEIVAAKDARPSSRRYQFSKVLSFSGSPTLRKVHRGRVNKKHYRRQ